jgi:hypothetical protein
MEIKIDTRQISKYTDLMKTIQKVIYSSWGKDKVRFTSAYPKVAPNDSIPTPLITYRMARKQPAVFGKVSEIKPRVRQTISSGVTINNEPLVGQSIEVLGQMFDYYVEFQVWAESGEEADEIAERFQDFMFKYTGFLKKLGVNEILFAEAGSDEGTAKWRSELVNRNLLYRIRIDEIVGVKCPVVEDIDVGITVDGIHFEVTATLLSQEEIAAAGKAMLETMKGKIEEFEVKE